MDIEAALDHALKNLVNHQVDEAIEEYRKILDMDGENLHALRFLGIALAENKKEKEAIPFLKKALALDPTDPGLHFNLAKIYQRCHQLDLARFHYQETTQKNPKHAPALTKLGEIYAELAQEQEALVHYQHAIHAAPDYLPAHYHCGLLFLKMGEYEAAGKQFKNIIQLHPKNEAALFYLGILALQADQLDASQDYFKELLAHNPGHVEAINNMGVIALKRDQRQLAVEYFTHALVFDEHHIEARSNLAATFIHFDRFENALMHYDCLLIKDPHNIEYRYNMGVAEMSLGQLDKAKAHFNFILTQDAHHFASLNNLAVIHMRLDEHRLAIDYLERAVKANPKDPVSQFMLEAFKGSPKAAANCPAYVKQLFDNYALNYESHLNATLKNTLPQHCARLLHQLECFSIKSALDLGCGTGLSGIILRELCQDLTGVDIAPKMIEQARLKGIYDLLVSDELLVYLRNLQKKFQLMLATDVLPYFGELDELFKLIKEHLSSDGLFVFSTEIHHDAPWHLQTNARFAHQPEYIQKLCQELNFKILSQNSVIARQEAHHDLQVMLYAVKNQT